MHNDAVFEGGIVTVDFKIIPKITPICEISICKYDILHRSSAPPKNGVNAIKLSYTDQADPISGIFYALSQTCDSQFSYSKEIFNSTDCIDVTDEMYFHCSNSYVIQKLDKAYNIYLIGNDSVGKIEMQNKLKMLAKCFDRFL